MAASAGGTVTSAGTLTPFSVVGFTSSLMFLNAGVLSFAQSIADMKMGLETPDGMSAEKFSVVKEIVKGLGGNEISQETIQLLFDAIGLKGAANLGYEGTLQLISVLEAADASAENIISLLEAIENQDDTKGNDQEDTSEDKKNREENKDDEEKKGEIR